MPKYKSEELLSGLIKDVQKIKESAAYFDSVDKNKMVYCPEKGKWSIVQILEHLNAYNRLYLPEIEKQLSVISRDNNSWFESGFWGEMLIKAIKPTNVFEIKNKKKTSRKFNFPNSLNVDNVLKEFNQHEDRLLFLLELARDKDLNKIRLPLTITNMIKLKLGDVFRFIVAHQQRHMIQARNTLKTIGIATDKFPVILQAVPQ
ncbi:MAG: DinB family protein [Candidatus Dadabacteria bacterium]